MGAAPAPTLRSGEAEAWGALATRALTITPRQLRGPVPISWRTLQWQQLHMRRPWQQPLPKRGLLLPRQAQPRGRQGWPYRPALATAAGLSCRQPLFLETTRAQSQRQAPARTTGGGHHACQVSCLPVLAVSDRYCQGHNGTSCMMPICDGCMELERIALCEGPPGSISCSPCARGSTGLRQHEGCFLLDSAMN